MGQPPNPRAAFRRSHPIVVGGVSKYSCAEDKTFRDTSFAAYHDVLVTYFLIFTRYLFYHINDDDDK